MHTTNWEWRKHASSPSPHLSPTGLSGQAEHAEQPALPEQALLTVARLIEALEKQGMGSQGAAPTRPMVTGAPGALPQLSLALSVLVSMQHGQSEGSCSVGPCLLLSQACQRQDLRL